MTGVEKEPERASSRPTTLPPQQTPALSAIVQHDTPTSRRLTIAGIAVMAGLIAVHFGLVNRAAWGGDEFTTFGAYRIGGLAYGWFRFWSWSPRPVSELLYGLYGAIVLLARKPLVVPLFVLGWIAFLAFALPTLRNRSRDGMASHVLGTTAILAFVLLGSRVFWVFYWPIAIVAYMPVIAMAVYLLVHIANEDCSFDEEPAVGITNILLVAVAWCSESGALVVLVFSGTALLYQFARRPANVALGRIMLRWTVPMMAALFVVGISLVNARTVSPIFASGDSAVYHNTLASLQASAARLPAEFLSVDGETFDAQHFSLGMFVRSLFFLGIYCCWFTHDNTARRGRHWLLVLTAALAVETWLELAATYRQFGDPCCGQHNEVRYGLELVALAAVAIWAPPIPRVPMRVARAIAPVFLVAAAAPMFLPRAKDLALDYVYYAEPERARGRTWESGYSPGPEMKLYQPPSDSVFPAWMPAGRQVADDNWWTRGILMFFGKASVEVVVAPQHAESP